MEKYSIAQDGFQYPKIFPIHSRNFTFITQEITNTLLKNFGVPSYHTMTWRSPRMSDQLNARATSETTRTWNAIHTIYSHIYCSKADMRRMIMMAKWYSVNHVGLNLPYICRTGEEKFRKNLIKETCPNRRSNPGPLRDWRACYNLLHSGGTLL